MFYKSTKEKFFTIAESLFFAMIIISFAFAQKPSFEVAPQSEPTVSVVSVAPATQDRGSSVIISATVVDVSGVSYAKTEIKNAANITVSTVNLYDDGAHGDGTKGDSVFASSWTIPATFAGGNYGIFIVASDTLGYVYQNAVANANLTVTIPACVPSKTCADYPGQCGTTLSNGCANVLNCSGSCAAPKICCSGTCKLPDCVNNSDCPTDGDVCTVDACNNGGTCSASCSYPSVGCVDGDTCCPAGCNALTDSDCAAPVLTTITVAPANPTITVGGTQNFIASPKDQFGNPIATAITWTSGTPVTGTIVAERAYLPQ